MATHSVSTQVENGYWINFIPNINISINDIIDKITPFLGIWEVSGSDPFPDTLSDTRVFIRQLTEDDDAQESVIKAWNPVYKRNTSGNPDMLRMFHSYWIFSIQKLEDIEANFTPYYKQLFRSLNFRQHLRDRNSPESDSVSLVLFDNFASTILDVSGSKIDYDTFDRLFNFNQDVSNHSITSSDLSINNIFALFIQDDVTGINIANFYKSNILQSNRLSIQSINLPNLEVLHFGKDSKCTTISRNSFNSSLGNLEQLILPDSIRTIDDFAFRNSGRLNFVLIPNNITTFGEGCFQDCSSLRIINFDYDVSNLKIIPKNFCKGNTSLNSCILPRSVTDICDSAFEGCLNLTHFEFSSINSIRHIGEAAFRGSGIKRISRTEDQAFFVGTQSTSNNNDADLTDIGIQAFANCNRLQIANLASFTKLRGVSETLFLDSSSLISVYLPPSVERIHESAFKGCSSLRYIFYSITNNFFKDIRMQRNFFNASTQNSINSSRLSDDPHRNPLHFFRVGDDDAVNLLHANFIVLRRNFDTQNLLRFSSFLSIIEANAFNGTIFNTIIIPSTCRTLSRNCFENSNISRIIFLGSLPQPLSSIFLYNFDSIDNTVYRSPFLRDDSYISSIFQTIFPDLDNSDNYFNFPIKDIIYFSNARNIRERYTLKLPWNTDNSFNTRNYFNVRKNDKIIARINFHEIDIGENNAVDNTTSLFGNIPINASIINALSSIYYLTIENLVNSISSNEVAYLYREQGLQSYYLNLSINNYVLTSLINNFENDNIINLNESTEIDSIVRLIDKFDRMDYFNIHSTDPSLNRYDLSFSVDPHILRNSFHRNDDTTPPDWPPYVRPLACGSDFGPFDITDNFPDINVNIPINKIGFLWTAYLGYAGLLEGSQWTTNETDLSNIYYGVTDFSINNYLFPNIYDMLTISEYRVAIQADNENGVGRRLRWGEFRNFYLHEQQNYLQQRNRFLRIVNNRSNREIITETITRIRDDITALTDLDFNFEPVTGNLGPYSDGNNRIIDSSDRYIMQNRFTIHDGNIYVLQSDPPNFKIRKSSLQDAIDNDISAWEEVHQGTEAINSLAIGTTSNDSPNIAFSAAHHDLTVPWAGFIRFVPNDSNRDFYNFDVGSITFLKRGPNKDDILINRVAGQFSHGYRVNHVTDQHMNFYTNNSRFGFSCRYNNRRVNPIHWYRGNFHSAANTTQLYNNSNTVSGYIRAPDFGFPHTSIIQVECNETYLYALSIVDAGTIFRANIEQLDQQISQDPIIHLNWNRIRRGVNDGETTSIFSMIPLLEDRNNRQQNMPFWLYRPKMVLYEEHIYLERDNRIFKLVQTNNS